ncbi:desmoplakin-like [Scleropages formosus]|uniref:desmoplakin-like n=1 Tax=Scleropages formosus TaxID=113540 RepID=UPI0008786C5A|nr:desmoplakin-like [Scleropages formosus]
MQKMASEEEVTRLKGHVAELEAMLAERQHHLERVQAEVDAQRKAIDDLTLQKSKAEYEAQQYRVELETMVKARAAAEQEVSRARQEVQQSEAKRASLEESLRMLKKNIEESTLARRKLEDHLRRKDCNVQDLEELSRTLERELKAKEAVEANLLSQVRIMEKDLAQQSESRGTHSEFHGSVVRDSIHQTSFSSSIQHLGSGMDSVLLQRDQEAKKSEVLQYKVEELSKGKIKAETEVKTLKSELNSVLVQKTIAEEKIQRFRDLLDETNNKMKKLQIDMDSERSTNRQKSEELRQEITELRKSVYIFQEQIKSLQRDKSSLEQKALFHKTEVEGLKEQLKMNQGKLLQKNSVEQESSKKIRSLEEDLAAKQAEGDQLRFTINELTRANVKLENDIKNLMVSIDSLQQEKSFSEQKLKSHKGEADSLKGLLHKTKEEFTLKTKSQQETQFKTKALEMELDKSNQVVAQLKKNVDELKKTNLETEQSMKALKSELDKVTMEMGSKDQQINIYKSQADSAKVQVKIIEEELLKKTQSLHDLQIKLRDYNEEVKQTSTLQEKNKALNLTIASYEKDIMNLKSELNSAGIDKKITEQTVQEQRTEINDLNLTLRKAMEELKKETTEGQKCSFKVKELENELQKSRQTMKGMTENSDKVIADLKREISGLQKDKAIADKQLSTLKAEFEGLNSSLRRTTEELQKETQQGRLHQSKIKELEGEVQRNKLTLKEVTSNSDKFISGFKQEISVLQRERSSAEEKSRSLTSDISLLKQKLEQTQEEVKRKQKETLASQLRSQKLEEQLENCKQMLEELKGKLDLQKKGYERQLELVEKEMEQKLLMKETSAKFEYDKKSREHLYSTETAERETKFLRQEIEQLKMFNQNTLKLKQEAEQQLDALRLKVDQLEKEKNVMNQELISAKTRITQLETEKIKFTASTVQTDNIRNVTAQENAKLKQKLSDTEQKLLLKEMEVRSLNEQSVSYVKEVKGLQEKILKLEVAISSENKKFKDMELMNQKNHQCAKDEEVAKLKNELLVAKRMVLSDEEIKAKLEEELRKLKISLEIVTREKEKAVEELRAKQEKTNIYNETKLLKNLSGPLEPQVKNVETSSYSHSQSTSLVHILNITEKEDYTGTTNTTSASEERLSSKGQMSTSNSITYNFKDFPPVVKDVVKTNEVGQTDHLESFQLQGLRRRVTFKHLVTAKILDIGTIQKLKSGQITWEEVEAPLCRFIGKTCAIAGVYLESSKKKVSFMEAAEKGFIAKTYAIEFLEAQAATGYMIDHVTGTTYSVLDAVGRGVVGKELKDKLLDAEKAVCGYAHSGKILSVFQAMEERILDRHKGRKILEAQIATGGLIDPQSGLRLSPNIALDLGILNRATLQSLYEPVTNPKGFHSIETGQKAYYCELLKMCVYDVDGGVFLLPFGDRHLSNITPSSTHRVSVINSNTGAEMSTIEAYQTKCIDKRTYLFLSQQETEWKESEVVDSSRGMLHVLTDVRSGRQFFIEHALSLKMLDKTDLEKYRLGVLSINEFADLLISRNTVFEDPHSPISGLWDISLKSRVSIFKGFQQNLLDRLTAVRLLEAQTCTGGICDPCTGEKLKVTEAVRKGLLDDTLARQLSQFEQAYNGIVHPQTGKVLTVAQAVQQNLFPRDMALRCLEFQSLTGGLIHPQTHYRVQLEEAVRSGLIDEATLSQVKDEKSHAKSLTCPRTKRKISFKEALERGVYDSHTGLKLIEATKPYSVGGASSFQYFWMY